MPATEEVAIAEATSATSMTETLGTIIVPEEVDAADEDKDKLPPNGPFQGDGADPSQAAVLIPARSTLAWMTYTISLNYNRLATSVLSPVTHWHWHDPIPHSSLILGAVPSSHLLRQLRQYHQVGGIVNMCAEFEGYLKAMQELDLVQCWVPTLDFHTPTVESIWIGVRFIEKYEK
ncbi:hypothetical protein BX616_002139, partial [Lobosporangium transversale]